MIDVTEIRQLSAEWSVREDVVEKDYSLGWLLAGIANNADLGGWVFKGGTCLRKCYYETYRFSEDLDFTIMPGAPEVPADLVSIFESVGSWLYDTCGLELQVSATSFKRTKNRRGLETTTGKVAFRGPRNPPTLAKIKLDLTSDEPVISETVTRSVFHPYSDASDPLTGVRCYSIVDLLARNCAPLLSAADHVTSTT